MATYTVREALTMARTIVAARAIDARITAVERAQCNETATALDGIIADLRPDSTLPNNRRNGAHNTLRDRLQAIISVMAAHEDLDPTELYNATDLMEACAPPDGVSPIRDGVATIELFL